MNATLAAKLAMFRAAGHIDDLRNGRDPVLVADLRTTICDARAALSIALGHECDRNGFQMPTGDLTLFEVPT